MLWLLVSSVMASGIVSRVVDRGFDQQSDKTKICKIEICCLSARHVAITGTNKDVLAWSLDNVSE